MIQRKKKINNLDLSHLKDSHLSIQFSLDGFSFCVFDKSLSKFTAVYEYHFEESNYTPQKLIANISSVFEAESILKEKFHSVNVVHVNDLATTVPKPLFDEDRLKDYLKFNTKVFAHDYFVFDEIKNHDIINVYIPFVNINNFLLDYYKGFDYKHHSTVLIENLLNIYKYSLVPHMFVHIQNSHFEVIVIANKKLQLYNTFSFHTNEDFIYYILFISEQLKMNPEKFELFLFGKVKKDDDFFSIAYQYIRNVKLLENRSKYNFDESITEDDKRTYFSLFNQY